MGTFELIFFFLNSICINFGDEIENEGKSIKRKRHKKNGFKSVFRTFIMSTKSIGKLEIKTDGIPMTSL